MNARVYLELDIKAGECARAVSVIIKQSGVLMADWLEDTSKVMVVIEAGNRKTLADLMMPVLASVEDITEGMRMLVNRGYKANGSGSKKAVGKPGRKRSPSVTGY